MRRHTIDRWTDTTTFSCMLIVSSVVVLPALAIGVLITLIGGAELLADGLVVDIVQAGFAALSLGGVIGLIGYVRALLGARNPAHHNVTATLLCLAAGVFTALVVSGFALTPWILVWMEPWRRQAWGIAPGLFAAANLVWAVAGVAWMQRLPRRYTEKTGRAFDGFPVVLLFVAMALATAAILNTTTL